MNDIDLLLHTNNTDNNSSDSESNSDISNYYQNDNNDNNDNEEGYIIKELVDHNVKQRRRIYKIKNAKFEETNNKDNIYDYLIEDRVRNIINKYGKKRRDIKINCRRCS